MANRWGYRTVAYIAPLAIASAIGCTGNVASPEVTDHVAEEVSAAGVTAAVTVTTHTATSWIATVTVTNGGTEPVSNWQVALNMGQSTFNGNPSQGEGLVVGGLGVVVPGTSNAAIGTGGSVSVTVNGKYPAGSTNWTPTLASVDGVASGTVGNASLGWKADGVDHVARAAATGALDLAIAYENNKLPNNGDANYALYDNLLWAAQSFVVSGGKIQFDSNMPGYSFIPNQALAELDAIQDSPEVASYLTSGLASCFADTKAGWLYNFRAAVLKGSLSGTTTKGKIAGQMPPPNDYAPPGYNPNTVVDNFTTVGLPSGGTKINVTLTSTTPNPDFWFGLLTYTSLATFSNPSAVVAKFNAGGQTVACSPFNGPGGSANPYFAMTLNGQAVPARFQGVGAQCYGTCTSTMVLDPVPYTTPGGYYNAGGLVGPQPNPFGFDPTQTAATLDHAGQWATTTSQTGSMVYGSFSSAIVHRGVTTGYAWMQK